MSAKSEPLSWEVLDYWKASGLPFSPSLPGSTVVYRDKEKNIKGFVAIGNRQDTALKFVLEPLIADSGPIALKLVDCLEKWMLSVGLPGYVFFVDTNIEWREQIERLVELEVFKSLGKQKNGTCWYGRKFR